ncbi:hypothetical protein H9Q08_03570 [Chryseobacterium sp. PS-8]|uniref:Uncharacterized protein n=1 Tax=Chryseobacterium indicum TaxID=2766954 RepID=A0ABS9C1E7_9FLAO|nr:hypothetical protein [Chryseobacterium sp. PS-8]MCF2218374.1 hypothetical protein [Chryseobacterium sp. PS-8]
MKSIKQGSKEWKEAIKAQQKQLQKRERFQVKVETKADADAFLKDMRDGRGMNRLRIFTKEKCFDERFVKDDKCNR